MRLEPRPLTAADAGAVAALMSRVAEDHPTGLELSAAEIVEFLTDYPGLLLEGGWVGDELAAYTAVLPRAPIDGTHPFMFFGDVDPTRCGLGFGTVMLGRALTAARAVHRRDAPHERARFSTRALQGRADQADLLTSHGFTVDRHNFLMVSTLEDLPAPVLPADLRLTTVDPAESEELRIAHNLAFRGYPNYTDVDQTAWRTFMVTGSHTRHDQSFVLRDPARGNAVAAYVLCHEHTVAPSGERGREAYVAYVGTVPDYRGRGLATHLLAHTLHACKDAGFATSSLDVDTDNPTGALGIYERAGYSVRHRQDNYALVE